MGGTPCLEDSQASVPAAPAAAMAHNRRWTLVVHALVGILCWREPPLSLTVFLTLDGVRLVFWSRWPSVTTGTLSFYAMRMGKSRPAASLLSLSSLLCELLPVMCSILAFLSLSALFATDVVSWCERRRQAA